jgi:hypothetical protein
MVRNDPKTGEEVSTVAHFKSKTHRLVGIDDTEETLNTMKEKNAEVLFGVSKAW